jgi:hypothetical protein
MGQDDRDYTANLNYHMVMSGLTPSATLADEFCCDAQQVVAANVIASAHSHSGTVNTVDDADLS